MKLFNTKTIAISNQKEGVGKTTTCVKLASFLKNKQHKTPIIIAVDLNFPYIRKQLKEMGLTNVYDSDFVFSKLELDLGACKNVGQEPGAGD